MSETQFSLSKFAAKYWLETTIGAIAILVLLVGIIVSQTNHQEAKAPPPSDTGADAGSAGGAPLVLGVLPGSAVVTLDTLKVNAKTQPFHYQKNATVTLTDGQALVLAGWAIDPNLKTSPAAVYVQVDGFARAQGSISDRPDVAQVLKNPDYQKSGFGITIPPALLAEGTHHLAFLVEDWKRTGYYVNPSWMTVVVAPRHLVASQARQLAGTTSYSLDRVVAGTSAPGDANQRPAPVRMRSSEALALQGWALDKSTNGLAGGVSAVIDGREDVVAKYGAARPDVALAYSNQLFAPCGFLITIPAGTFSKGVHEVSLRIYSSDGSGYYLVKDRVQVTAE